MKSFGQLAAELAKPGTVIASDLGKSPVTCHILHMAMGISGEAGELLDAIKKVAFYGTSWDRDNIVEELGDIRFYMAGLMNAINISEGELLKANNDKLAKRYAEGSYSNEAAVQRADKQDDKLHKPKEDPLKVGDTVRIVDRESSYFGRTGYLLRIFDGAALISINGTGFAYRLDYVEKVEDDERPWTSAAKAVRAQLDRAALVRDNAGDK